MTMRRLKFVPPQMKMRQRNTAERLFLERRLADMDALYHKHDRKYRTDISTLQCTLDEFSRDGGDRVLQYFDFKIFNGTCDRTLKKAEKRSGNSAKEKKIKFVSRTWTGTNNTCPSEQLSKDDSAYPKLSGRCVLNTNSPCPHFPCTMPKGYNSLGFQLKRRPYPKSAGCVTDSMSSCDALSVSGHGGCRSSAKESKLSIRDKLNTLRLVLEERKRKMATLKPEPWEINYGRPVPLRRIHNPVRPATTGDLVLSKHIRS